VNLLTQTYKYTHLKYKHKCRELKYWYLLIPVDHATIAHVTLRSLDENVQHAIDGNNSPFPASKSSCTMQQPHPNTLLVLVREGKCKLKSVWVVCFHWYMKKEKEIVFVPSSFLIYCKIVRNAKRKDKWHWCDIDFILDFIWPTMHIILFQNHYIEVMKLPYPVQKLSTTLFQHCRDLTKESLHYYIKTYERTILHTFVFPQLRTFGCCVGVIIRVYFCLLCVILVGGCWTFTRVL